jgi:hypothetical protein
LRTKISLFPAAYVLPRDWFSAYMIFRPLLQSAH